jgi:hypothetical protein
MNSGERRRLRLLSRRAVAALIPRAQPVHEGLFAWIGYLQEIAYARRPLRGETKWSYWRLWNFALKDHVVSVVPLKIASYVGS